MVSLLWLTFVPINAVFPLLSCQVYSKSKLAYKSGTAGNSCPWKFLVPAFIPAENLSKLLNSPVISVSRCNNEPTTLKLFVGYHSREASKPVISDSGTLTSPPKEPKIKSSKAPKTCLSL